MSRAQVGALPQLADLRREAAAANGRGLPLTVLISRSDCSFCHEVRVQYLAPKTREGSMVAVELVSDFRRTVRMPDGRALANADAARLLGGRFFPTVVFLGADGKPLAEPIVGAGKGGFYEAFLDDALAAAAATLRAR
jgi:hypothetical protein